MSEKYLLYKTVFMSLLGNKTGVKIENKSDYPIISPASPTAHSFNICLQVYKIKYVIFSFVYRCSEYKFSRILLKHSYILTTL